MGLIVEQTLQAKFDFVDGMKKAAVEIFPRIFGRSFKKLEYGGGLTRQVGL